MEIRFQKVAYTLVLAAGFATLVGCDAGGSTVPSNLAPGTTANTPTPNPAPGPTPRPTPTPTGSATVSWTAPVARVDNTSASMSDISSYNVYYGTSPTALSKVIHVADAYKFTYTITNLAASTYYFAVTAFDSTGIESSYSNVVTRVIQ